jgi:hypothetical protein
MFIVIWGFRSRVSTAAMLTLACRNNHVAAHRLAKVTRWFTLFFIPLFPVSHKYFSVCTQCGQQVRWSKEDALAAVARGSGTAPSVQVDPVAAPITTGQPLAGSGSAPWPTEDAVSAQPVTSGPPAGWYPDPNGANRYWDGQAWTEHVHPGSGG